MCFALPIAMLVLLSVWGGIYPFGPESFLTEDLKYQYIDFFTWYRRVLLGDANIFYSFAQGMGSNTWGLYSYYLASPFNLLIVLFDESHLTLAIYIIVALKLGCMSCSMTWYLRRRFGVSCVWALTLALCYTWSTWMATNLRNPLWLDALILLPLMAWGCYQLIRKGTFLSFALLVAADVICCWYMAYITLLFCCFFVLFELAVYVWTDKLASVEQKRDNCSSKHYTQRNRAIGNQTATGQVCAHSKNNSHIPGYHITARWVFGRALRFTFAIALGLALSAWTFVPTILAMLDGSPTQEIVPVVTSKLSLIKGFLPCLWDFSNVPQFYIGIVPLLLTLYFLANHRISGKLRLLLFCFAGFLTASSVFGHLQFIWCGMRVPNGFYSRTAFLLGFLEIWAAGFLLHSKAHSTASLLKLQHPIIALCVMSFAIVDLTFNAHICMNQLYTGYTQEAHEQYNTEASKQLDKLKEREDEPFWRFDKTYTRIGAAFNEGIAQEFMQLSTYSSANNPKAVALLNSLGYSSEGEFSSVYAAPNLFMDSLLGVTYAATCGTPAGYVPTQIAPSENRAAIYANPYALSFGFSAAASAEDLVEPLVGNNPFERMNSLASKLNGANVELFKQLNPAKTANDAQNLTWEVSVPANFLGYTYVIKGTHVGSYQPIQLTIDSQVISLEGWRFANNVRTLGNEIAPAETTHQVSISPVAGTTDIPEGTSCVFYALNMPAFENLMASLKARQFVPSVFEDGFIGGTYATASNATLVFSMPYDHGWTVLIDGTEAQLKPAFNGGMSALELNAGTHHITMTYRSPGLLVGCIISGTAVLVFILTAVNHTAKRVQLPWRSYKGCGS